MQLSLQLRTPMRGYSLRILRAWEDEIQQGIIVLYKLSPPPWYDMFAGSGELSASVSEEVETISGTNKLLKSYIIGVKKFFLPQGLISVNSEADVLERVYAKPIFNHSISIEKEEVDAVIDEAIFFAIMDKPKFIEKKEAFLSSINDKSMQAILSSTSHNEEEKKTIDFLHCFFQNIANLKSNKKLTDSIDKSALRYFHLDDPSIPQRLAALKTPLKDEKLELHAERVSQSYCRFFTATAVAVAATAVAVSVCTLSS